MKKFVSRIYPFAIVLFGVLSGGYAIYRNPGAQVSHQKYLVMQKDMGELLSLGGMVAFKKSSDKYGGSSLLYGIFASSLSEKVRVEQYMALERLGWMAQNASHNRYCKNGILFYSKLSEEHYESKSVLIVAMIYGPDSIDECGALPQNGVRFAYRGPVGGLGGYLRSVESSLQPWL